MGIDFKPKNALEQAIYDRNSEMVIYAIAENNMLTTLAPASNLGNECFSDEVIFSVLLNAVTEKQLHTMTDGWFQGHLKVGERLRKLVDETLAPLPQDPSAAEKKLIKAIVWRENKEIIPHPGRKCKVSRICSGIADNAAGTFPRSGFNTSA